MATAVDKYYDGSAPQSDVRLDDIPEDQFFEALNTQRFNESYSFAEPSVQDYSSLSQGLGYEGEPTADMIAIQDHLRKRKEARKLVRDKFESTGKEKLRSGLNDLTKDIPFVGAAMRFVNHVDRIKDLAASTAGQFAVDALRGTVEQIAASGTQGTGAPGVTRTDGKSNLEGAKELVQPLVDLRDKIPEDIGVDPDLANSVLGQTIQVATSLGTGFAALAINPTLGITAFESLAFSEAVDEYDTHAKNPNPEDRVKFGLSVAIPTMLLDVAFGGEATLARLMARAPQTVRREMIKRIALSIPKEGITEGLQGEVMKLMANSEFDQDREHFNGEFFRDVLIGMAGAGVAAPAISIPILTNTKLMNVLENENYARQAFATIQKNTTKEQFLEGAGDNPAAKQVLEAAYDGDTGAQQTLMLLSEQERAKNEAKAIKDLDSKDKTQVSKEGIKTAREARDTFLGDQNIPQVEKVRFRDVMQEAQRKGIDRDTDVIVDRLDKEGGVMTLEEHMGVLVESARLMKQHTAKVIESADAIEAGNLKLGEKLSQDAQQLSDRLDKIERVTDKARSEAGRVLAIGRARLDQEMSLDFALRQAQTLKGDKLTSKEVKEIERLNKKLVSANKKLKKLATEITQLKNANVHSVLNSKDITKVQKRNFVKASVAESLARRASQEHITSFKDKKLWDQVGSIASAPRALIASADLSATLRQGLLLSARRPVAAGKALGKSAQAYFSETSAEESDLYLRSRPTFQFADRMGLYHGSMSRVEVSAREETFSSEFADKLWHVRASGRQMVTQLNFLRAAAFDAAYYDLKKRKLMTDEEMAPIMKKYAAYVNAASGRGTLFGMERSARALATVFFAPRWAVSRFEAPVRAAMMLNTPLAANVSADIGSFVGLIGIILTLGAAGGATVSTDPDDSDFLKMKIGDTRLDWSGGFGPGLRLVTNFGRSAASSAGLIDDFDSDIRDQFQRFFMYKASPVFNMTFELMTHEDAVGNEIEFMTAEDLSQNFFVKNTVPLFLQDTWDAINSDDPEVVGLAAPLAFFGVGAGTFEKD